MLREFKAVSQPSDGFRRAWCDENFDLFVWYDRPGGNLKGFQLVELKDMDSDKAFTWTPEQGGLYTSVWTEGWYNPTPILVANGALVKAPLLSRFQTVSTELDPAIRDLVLSAIGSFSA